MIKRLAPVAVLWAVIGFVALSLATSTCLPDKPNLYAADPAPVAPAVTVAPALVLPAAPMQVGVQYPIDLKNCSADVQTHSCLVVHPKAGVTIYPVSWVLANRCFSAPRPPEATTSACIGPTRRARCKR